MSASASLFPAPIAIAAPAASSVALPPRVVVSGSESDAGCRMAGRARRAAGAGGNGLPCCAPRYEEGARTYRWPRCSRPADRAHRRRRWRLRRQSGKPIAARRIGWRRLCRHSPRGGQPRATIVASATSAAMPSILDRLVMRLARGGEINLAGFYDRAAFLRFPAAFMREARIRVSAEWSQGRPPRRRRDDRSRRAVARWPYHPQQRPGASTTPTPPRSPTRPA